MAADTSYKKNKGLKRELSGTSPYKTENVKYVVDMLTSLNTASAAIAKAGDVLAGINAHDISPDGLIGGRGYVTTIKDIRQDLTSAANIISDLNDALADELNNPKWELTPEDVEKYKEQAKSGEAAASEEPAEDFGLSAPESEGEALEGGEPAAEESDTTELPTELPELFGESAPESTTGEPAAPAEEPAVEATIEAPVAPAPTAPELPYKKLASLVGHPERDMVSRLLRGPILFNILDGHTADNH